MSPERTVGLDAGVTQLPEADHLLLALTASLGLPPAAYGCTHVVGRGERPRLAVSFTLPGAGAASAVWSRLTAPVPPLAGSGWGAAFGERRYGDPDAAAGAADAAGQAAGRAAGRAVRFPGADGLRGTLSVARVLGSSAVDRVTVLGSGDAPAGASLVTRDFVRPTWTGGALVLAAMPAAGGVLVPFEVPDPTPCCADH